MSAPTCNRGHIFWVSSFGHWAKGRRFGVPMWYENVLKPLNLSSVSSTETWFMLVRIPTWRAVVWFPLSAWALGVGSKPRGMISLRGESLSFVGTEQDSTNEQRRRKPKWN